MKTDLFQACGHCSVFQVCWHIECSTIRASSFRIWKSSAEIPSPPLALLIVRIPKAHLTSHSRMSSSRWGITLSWLSRSIRPFLYSSSVYSYVFFLSVLLSSFTQLCPTLCDPIDCNTPGLPVHHQLPEFTQTHVDWVGDAIQPSHPRLSPSSPAFNLSQHQGLFQWVSSSHQGARALELQFQHQSLQWIFRTDFL